MLFDLSSPGRKNVVRVVFSILALLFFVGFIGFGVGTSGGGGIFDSITGNGGGSTDDAFEQQIEDQEDAIDKNPQDASALASLALLRTQSGDAQLERDESTGAPTGLSEDSRDEYEKAITAWEQYLKTKPQKINVATANAVVLAYRYLGDIDGAIKAQTVLAESDPSGPAYGALASFLYSDLQIPQGDKARDQAIEESNSQTAKLIEKQLEQIRKQALKAKEKQDKQPNSATGEAPELEDPFGGLNPADPGAGIAP
jgi:hypothetical protein